MLFLGTVSSYYYCFITKWLDDDEVISSLEHTFGNWYGYNRYDYAGNPFAVFYFWDERDAVFAKLRWPELEMTKGESYPLSQKIGWVNKRFGRK